MAWFVGCVILFTASSRLLEPWFEHFSVVIDASFKPSDHDPAHLSTLTLMVFSLVLRSLPRLMASTSPKKSMSRILSLVLLSPTIALLIHPWS
jgi:hypothetical protein